MFAQRVFGFLLPACVMLSACTEYYSYKTEAPRYPIGVTDTCQAGSVADIIGAPAAAAEALNRRTPMRIIKPQQPVTMDYIAQRLNVELDGEGNVHRLFCG